MQRVIGRQMMGEGPLKVDRTGFTRLAILVIGAGFVIEMSRPGDVGILQGVRPGAELAGAGFGEGYEL
jgi:hypothetical protein